MRARPPLDSPIRLLRTCRYKFFQPRSKTSLPMAALLVVAAMLEEAIPAVGAMAAGALVAGARGGSAWRGARGVARVAWRAWRAWRAQFSRARGGRGGGGAHLSPAHGMLGKVTLTLIRIRSLRVVSTYR